MTNNKVVDTRRYQIIQGVLLTYVVDTVNEYLDRGYEPIGNVFVSKDGMFYCQTIYKGKG